MGSPKRINVMRSLVLIDQQATTLKMLWDSRKTERKRSDIEGIPKDSLGFAVRSGVNVAVLRVFWLVRAFVVDMWSLPRFSDPVGGS